MIEDHATCFNLGRDDGMILAHAGGWDELLLVLLAPLALVAVLLVLANRFSDEAAESHGDDAEQSVERRAAKGGDPEGVG